jgi:hypothetical protein
MRTITPLAAARTQTDHRLEPELDRAQKKSGANAAGACGPSEFSELSLEKSALPPSSRPLLGLTARSEFLTRGGTVRIG